MAPVRPAWLNLGDQRLNLFEVGLTPGLLKSLDNSLWLNLVKPFLRKSRNKKKRGKPLRDEGSACQYMVYIGKGLTTFLPGLDAQQTQAFKRLNLPKKGLTKVHQGLTISAPCPRERPLPAKRGLSHRGLSHRGLSHRGLSHKKKGDVATCKRKL